MDKRTFDRSAPRTTWVLLAHRGGAKIFSQVGGQVTLLQEIDHPDGRKHNRDMTTDGEGSRFGSVSSGNITHGGVASGSRVEATEHVADVFALRLAEVLRDGRTHAQFDDMILVSEPKFLGRLRSCLDTESAKLILASVNTNWSDVPPTEVLVRVRDLVIENRKIA